MAVESPFIGLYNPDRLAGKPKKQLFQEVIDAQRDGIQLNIIEYLDAFLRSEGYTLKIETGEIPDPDKPLVLAVNHHSRQRFFTTEESLRTVGIASVSARQAGVTDKSIAWMVRQLRIPPVGIGKMARQVQNATGPVFDSIPARTIKRLSRKGKALKYRETMTDEDTQSLLERVAHRVQNGFALGVFPEQEPSFSLRPYHRNFARTLGNLKFLSPDYQVLTLACFYEGKVARAVYGPVIDIKKETNVQEAATAVMHGIAQGMPIKLQGAYPTPQPLQ